MAHTFTATKSQENENESESQNTQHLGNDSSIFFADGSRPFGGSANKVGYARSHTGHDG